MPAQMRDLVHLTGEFGIGAKCVDDVAGLDGATHVALAIGADEQDRIRAATTDRGQFATGNRLPIPTEYIPMSSSEPARMRTPPGDVWASQSRRRRVVRRSAEARSGRRARAMPISGSVTNALRSAPKPAGRSDSSSASRPQAPGCSMMNQTLRVGAVPASCSLAAMSEQ